MPEWTDSPSLCYTGCMGTSLNLETCLTWSLLLTLTGCAAAPPAATVQAAPAASAASAAPAAPTDVQPPAATPAAAATMPEATAAPATPPESAAPGFAGAVVPAPSAVPPPVAKPTIPTGVVKAKPPTPPKAAAPPAAVVAAKPTPEQRPAAPALDLTALEQRLRDTRAIGLFTKLSLKNQVDDLLGEFRAHFRSQDKPPLTALRQRYDLLLMKVLILLQDGDPPLASAINSSREAIWSMLNDPAKLTTI